MIEEVQNTDRSRRYSAIKARVFMADLLVTAGLMIVFQMVISLPLSEKIASLIGNFYVSCFFYASIFMIYMYILGLPLCFFGSFYIDHHFDLSEQSFKMWFIDDLKSAGLRFIILMAGVQVFYLLLRNYPDMWWLMLSAVWFLFSVVLARIAPLVIIPLFFKYLPVNDDELQSKLIELGKRARVQVTDICRIDLSRKTKKANAALVGLGKSRKVLLGDTLTNEFTREEIETVVAHEFGHHKYLHMWQLLGFSGAVTAAGFFIVSRVADRIVDFFNASGPFDLYIFPALVFLLMLYGVLVIPTQNLFSRILERQADRFALKIIDDPAVFISVMEKLGAMNLADKEPGVVRKIFLFNHPPINERIKMAEEWGQVLNLP